MFSVKDDKHKKQVKDISFQHQWFHFNHLNRADPWINKIIKELIIPFVGNIITYLKNMCNIKL